MPLSSLPPPASSGRLAEKITSSLLRCVSENDGITTLYRTRWNVEPYHKSLKQNASLEKSPTQTVTTQTNHFFAGLCAYLNLEMLKVSTQLNHFALKTKLYARAVQVAFGAMRQPEPVRLAA